jgi:hypothetical protein
MFNNTLTHSALDRLEKVLAEIYAVIQDNQRPVNVIVPKEMQEPTVINVKIPDIVINIPEIKQPTIKINAAPIVINTPKADKPIINVRLPKQKIMKESREQQIVRRDASGAIIGTQSIEEYVYGEEK